jgi:hypothetical protein
MKRTCIALIAVCLCASQLDAAKIKLLAIGNSFSEDAVENYLYDIAPAGGDTLIIGNMYIGGCSLETHRNNANTDAAAYSYRKIDEHGTKTTVANKRLSEAIVDEDWDYISFQQVSQNSGKYNTYFPYLSDLLAYTRSLVTNPAVQYVLHQTWAYAKTSTHSGFANYANNQELMYTEIVDAVSRVAETAQINIVIPAGTAIQNARSSYIGDNFCRDGYHLDTGIGRYTAACTWYEKLTGKNVVGNTFTPAGLSPNKIALAQQAAHNAVQQPLSVTGMSDYYVIPDGETFVLNHPVYIHFGTRQAAIPWNNLSGFERGAALQALLDTLGNETPLRIEVSDAFCGINSNGPGDGLSTDKWRLPPEATSESFFGNAGNSWGNRTELTAGFLISNLNKDEAYDFLILAGRMNVTDNRDAYYTITGTNTATVYVNNSNNIELVEIRGIAPLPDGTITIKTGAGAYNDNVNKFYHINALQIAKSNTSPSVVPAPALGNPVNINFGSRRGVENTWNNLPHFELGYYLQGLIDTEGHRTPLRIEVSDAFGGINTLGPADGVSTADWTLPADVTKESFFGNEITFNNRVEVTGGFLISNLNADQTFDLRLFASRTGADNRETRFTVEGANSETVSVNSSNNTSQATLVRNIAPKPDGTIRIESGAGSNNNNANRFFYINALQIVPNETRTSIASVGQDIGQVRQVYVYSLQGRLLYAGENVDLPSDRLDSANSLPKVYIVKLVGDKGTQTFKTVR